MKKILFVVAMLLSTAGFAQQIQSATLTASGLTCSMCSKAIYKALLKVPSIQKVDVDIEKSAYTITFKPGAPITPDALRKAVENAGFSISSLQMTAAGLPRTTVGADTRVAFQGATYRLIRATGKTLQGTQTFTVVDKAYLSAADWKRLSKEMPAQRESGVYYVTL